MWLGAGCLGMILFTVIFYQGAKYDNSFIMGFAVVGFILFNIIGLYMDYKRRQKFAASLEFDLDEILNKLEYFLCSQKFYSVDKESMIAIDETNRKICIIQNQHNNLDIELSKTFSKFNYVSKILKYDEILQSEIIEDNITVTKASRSGQVGGALLGSILAGGVGALIGGLSASTTSSNKVKNLQLQIVVNDSQKSFYRILFTSFREAVPKTNLQYKKSYNEILHWHNMLSYLIKVVDKEDSDKLDNSDLLTDIKLQNLSLADELLKLSELVKKELITQEEYEKLKIRLIN